MSVSPHRMEEARTEMALAGTDGDGQQHGGSQHQQPGVAMTIGSKPTLIALKSMQFLIMDAPKQGNLHLYIKEMRKHSVQVVVRVCEPTYQKAELISAGIGLEELEYKDGTSPPQELIDRWLALVDNTFFQPNSLSTSATSTSGGSSESKPAIAVHCVAGLGRAPVMVALALIEFGGLDPVEAVTLIRQQRRGAINEKQLLYLEGYRKSYRRAGTTSCCVIL